MVVPPEGSKFNQNAQYHEMAGNNYLYMIQVAAQFNWTQLALIGTLTGPQHYP